MPDDLILRTYERAAELAERSERNPDDAYAKRWARIMQSLGDSAVDSYRRPVDASSTEGL